MPPDLTPWVVQGGAVSLLAWGVWLLYTGRLVPRRVLDERVASEAQRADDWRAAYQREATRAAERDAQLAHILAAVRERSPS